jgi:hypothetical protein
MTVIDPLRSFACEESKTRKIGGLMTTLALRSRLFALAVTMALPYTGLMAQEGRSRFEGMWSDPPISALDTFCAGACTDAGLDFLAALLDDPANDDRPYADLTSEAAAHQVNEYLRPLLTDAALTDFPIDRADDPGFLYCRPWGIARQLTARHQLEIDDRGDRIEMRYGEWAARRTIYMDGRAPAGDASPTAMGYSVGRYDSEELVIETTAISADLISNPEMFEHSEQLRIVERYKVAEDGQRLFLTATYEDPMSLKEPLVLKKIWGWAPEEEIYPEVECERPTDFIRRGEP